MFRSKVCLTLTDSTLEKNLALVEKYRSWIDLAELRVDHLDSDERLYIRRFPEMAKLPVILTIRRKIDGGNFVEGEAARSTLFARGLAFADQDLRKNFAYIDLEDDYKVPSLQDAAFAFGTRVIRSVHHMNGPIRNICAHVEKLRVTGYEIPKIAFMPETLQDVTNLFREAQAMPEGDRILIAMNSLGQPSRILAGKLRSFLTFTSAPECIPYLEGLGHIDPVTLFETYNFSAIDDNTHLFGIAGYSLRSAAPEMQNAAFRRHNMKAVVFPIRSPSIEDIIDFAECMNLRALSIDVPHKETTLNNLMQISAEAGEIGAVNMIIRNGMDWAGFNTDAMCLSEALLGFLGQRSLRGMRISIIGAGGTAKAAAYVVKTLRGKACIFNKKASRAQSIAQRYGFQWAPLEKDSANLIATYSDLIIQTTTIGANTDKPGGYDPIPFYRFSGSEAVFDIICRPEKTQLLKRAETAGCRISNGQKMLKAEAEKKIDYYRAAIQI